MNYRVLFCEKCKKAYVTYARVTGFCYRCNKFKSKPYCFYESKSPLDASNKCQRINEKIAGLPDLRFAELKLKVKI